MKRFYIKFFVGFIFLSSLLYFSIWWFFAGVAMLGVLTFYHFYRLRIQAYEASLEEMELKIDSLQTQLDRSLLREDKAVKETAQVRQLKDKLLYSMSHEIRTPMNGVLGMAQLITGTPLTEEQKEYIDTIRSSGQSLLTTVNSILASDILNNSKLEQLHKTKDNTDFDLRDTVEETIVMFSEKASNAGLELLFEINEDVPLQLNGDNRRLREILMNLLENAIKFTPHGEVILTVQSLSDDFNRPVLRFEVKDTGIGIAEEQLKKLFYSAPGREFYGGEKKSAPGLVVCRKKAEMLGGKIEVQSKPGFGSTFVFTVPMSLRSSQEQNVQQNIIRGFAGRRVLIVDDNQSSRNILSRQLQAWNMLPQCSASGEQAIEILERNSQFDLLIADQAMPQMNGLQLASIVKNKFPQVKALLLATAANEVNKQEQELFSAVMIKPVRQQVLRDHIYAAMREPTREIKTEASLQENILPATSNLRILLAEDNLINQKIAVKLLGKQGYQPAVASNGKEAVEMWSRGQFNMILMDVQMPEMDGLDATRLIRSRPNDQPVIIAMTANVLQGDRDACIQAGMDDYISKPVNPDELYRQLEKWSMIIEQRRKTA
jgi:signal transduction histidine kinase/CheY-like chemotaxis protein